MQRNRDWRGVDLKAAFTMALVFASPGCESGASDSPGGGQGGALDNGSETDTRGQKRHSHDPNVNVRQSIQSIASALAHVCTDGFSGDATAPQYDPRSPGPHRIVAITTDGVAHSWNEGLPEAWLPESVADVELVACVEPTKEWKAETCDNINGPDVNLYARTTALAIVSVHSGERAEENLSSANPRRCPSTYTAPDLYPDAAGPEEFINNILYRYVPLPECYEKKPYFGCYQCRDTAERAAYQCTAEDRSTRSSQRLLPAVEVGDTVILRLPDGFPSSELDARSPPFDRHSHYLYDWSESPDAATLPAAPYRSAEVVASEERRYSYLIDAKVPGFDGDPSLDRIELTFQAIVRRPLDKVAMLGIARVGEQFTLKGSIDGKVFSTRCAWTVVKKPEGSAVQVLVNGTAIELGIDDAIEPSGCGASFRPDVPGQYQFSAALHYTDVGYSEPFESEVLTVFDKPLIEPVNTEVTGSFPGSILLEAELEHVSGTAAATWTVLSGPAGASVRFAKEPAITAADVAYHFWTDLPGEYVIQLSVEDRGGVSAPVVFNVRSVAE